MGVKRIVDTSFWIDGKVDEFSPEDKYFMLYLLTNPFTRQLGIYEISIKQAAFQMGYSIDAVNVLLDRFENKYNMIIWSKETNEIAIVNFLRHSVIKGGKPVEDCIKQDIARVKNKRLIYIIFKNLAERNDLNCTIKKIVSDYINDYDNDNDNHNDNDNDNDSIVPVSYHDSYNDSSACMNPPVVPPDGYPEEEKPKKKKPAKHKYGEYSNVLLTDEELDKLKSKFPDWNERIENLSLYIESKGARYKSHYATILNWARREYTGAQKIDSRGQNGSHRGNLKTGTAEELDNFYNMAKEWALEREAEKQ